ncbi:MAG: DUF3810 family protein [Acidobacteria bacterium]|nr:DUF3810 family protein [Acidobacteriota bacterium]
MPLPVPLLRLWRAAYVVVQPAVSWGTSWLPIAALDVLIVAGMAWMAWRLFARRGPTSLAAAVVTVLSLAAAGWLWFLASWGWHYQVPTLEARLDVSAAAVSPERGESFARAIVQQANALHAEAHRIGWPDRATLARTLAPRLAAVLPVLGVTRQPWLPRPRRTLLDGYFRAAGVDGMTNPFGLEVLLNSRVLPMELPALAAHEYAHLAGFADESDASVVAWLACQTGEAPLRYSAALAVLPHVLAGLPRERQATVLTTVGDGPRADLEAIGRRLSEQRPWVHAFAWQSYDRFLRANRVSEGVARYDAVARVLIAATDPATGSLSRRPRPPFDGR